GILQRHLRRRRAQRPDPEQQGEQGGGERDGELGCDRPPLAAPSAALLARAHHDTVSARRTRSVRMPRTSSERMITTRSPANATAAIVVMAYSAVAAPVSSVNIRAARPRVSAGRSFFVMSFLLSSSLSWDASRPVVVIGLRAAAASFPAR